MAINLQDRRLARRLVAGDERAFDEFFTSHFARLYRFAAPRLSDDASAIEEVVQQTLAKALRGIKRYRGEAALFTWTCAICRNEIADWKKRNARYSRHLVLTEDMPEIKAVVESFQAPDCDHPEQVIQRSEALRLIQVALDQLPPRQASALEWKYIEGYSVREIATRLDLGREAAQSLLARARRSFAEIYHSLTSINDLKGRSASS